MGEPTTTKPYLTQVVHRGARTWPDEVCIVAGDRVTTARGFADDVARLAGGARLGGLETGGCAAILAPNSDRYIEAMFATMWAGAAACPLNVRWTPDEVAAAVDSCGATVAFVDRSFAPVVAGLRALPALRTVVYMDDQPLSEQPLSEHGTGPVTVGWEHLLAGPPVEDAGRGGDDVALILYTAGTTGVPKGVQLTHGNLFMASISMRAAGCGTGPVYLHAPPLFHIAGVQVMLAHFLGEAGRHIVVPGFEPRAVMEAIETHRVTDVMLVPTMLQMLLTHPAWGEHDMSSLQRIFYGAAPMPDTLLRAAMEAIPGVGFAQGYGMTETAVSIMLPPRYYTPAGLTEGRTGSIGRPLPTTDVAIRDTGGAEMPRGSVGELTVRGPSVMLGYLRRPEETAATIRNGWLYTGDGAYMDEDGFLYLTDRLKDMIITGGENVYSIEVESVLVTHPSVTTAAVIGVPHPSWGEQVHAVVTLAPGAELSVEDVITHCRSRLAGFKCPKSVDFRDVLPYSATGKVLKGTLRAESRSALAKDNR